MSCGYQGYEFGASYLDSVCIDGRLFDADNCDDHGNLYEPTSDLACPMCHASDAIEGYIASGWKPFAAWHLVMDIRKNRGKRTQPFALWRHGRRRRRKLRATRGTEG